MSATGQSALLEARGIGKRFGALHDLFGENLHDELRVRNIGQLLTPDKHGLRGTES